jgi:CDP-glucose 4,6-dehydratase
MNTNSFWKNKKVFVTGHTGFKGAWLTLMLHELGAKVTGYSSNVPTEPSFFELTRCSELLDRDHRGDIRDLDKVKSALKESKAEIVFHLAAQSLVRPSYADPFTTFGTNVMGTLNVLMAANEVESVKSLINITTDKCYENKETQKSFSEEDKLGGHDPYSGSKACAEILSASIRSSFLDKNNKHMATVRAGNVIGGGDWAQDRLIPDIMRAFITREKFKVRNPSSTRPWQHVMEPIGAYLLLAEKNYVTSDFAEAFNIGPESSDHATVLDLTRMFLGHFPDHPGMDTQGISSELHEAKTLMLDCTKARTKLCWKPKLHLKEAVKLTAEWYRAQLERKDLRELTLNQIRNYL